MFDILIKGGRIVDGSGNPWFHGDVGIRGNRIAAVGKIDTTKARNVIIAGNKVVCPGFIDMHTHSDVMLLAHPNHEPKIMQGVTTDVLGLDGISYAPLSPPDLEMTRRYLSSFNGNPAIEWDWSSVGEYLARFDLQAAVNVAYLVPHNALRMNTIGFNNRQATAEELNKMQNIVEQGMKEGAVGFSTGLDYFPNRYSNTEELTAICRTVAGCDGLSVWHIRKIDLGLMEGIREAINVGLETNVKVHISHLAASGAYRGKGKEILKMIDEAREEGLDITFDTYPYTAGCSPLNKVFPDWVHEGGPGDIMDKLRDRKTRDKMCREFSLKFDVKGTQKDKTGNSLEKMYINDSDRGFKAENRKYIGKSIGEAAELSGKDPCEFVCDLLVDEELNVTTINRRGSEEDIREILQHPCHTGGSDGILVGRHPHPRAWGTFVRFIRVYCLDLGLLRLEEMIRHMTSAPASRIGQKDRGMVKEGFAADLVVFDPHRIKDTATFEDPKRHPEGIEYVLVNGAVVVDQGNHTGVLKGRALANNH